MNLQLDLRPCGIGSLPFTHPEPALHLIDECLSEIPHWPQLPKRGHREHFVYQYLAPLVNMGLLKEEPGHSAYMDPASPDWSARLTDFYALYLAACEGDQDALRSFATPEDAAAGFYSFLRHLTDRGTGGARCLKGQVAGPLSVALNTTDTEKRLAYYNPQLREVLVKALAMNVRWQVQTLRQFGLPVFLFVDEPAVSAYGTSTYVSLSRNDLVEDLGELSQAACEAGGTSGAHSCSGIDWTIFFEAGFKVVSFDAYNYFSSLLPYVDELKEYIQQGGVLAWGVVPTNDDAWQATAESLSRLWSEKASFLVSKGIDRERLFHQGLITPSCGTGALAPELARHVYRLMGDLSKSLRGDN